MRGARKKREHILRTFRLMINSGEQCERLALNRS